MDYYMETADLDGERHTTTLYDAVDVTVSFPEEEEGGEPVRPDHPSQLANWVGVDINDETIRLSVSLADPRGAVEMVLRSIVDEDGIQRTQLTVPTDQEEHVLLRPVGPGTFLVGHGRYPDPPRVTEEEVQELQQDLRDALDAIQTGRAHRAPERIARALEVANRLGKERNR